MICASGEARLLGADRVKLPCALPAAAGWCCASCLVARGAAAPQATHNAHNTHNTHTHNIHTLHILSEPLFADAGTACWWELLPLASHAHPSVAAFARSLLAGSHIVYDGDPLRDLTLPSFLDKFIQRKPKVGARAACLPACMYACMLAGCTCVQELSSAQHTWSD